MAEKISSIRSKQQDLDALVRDVVFARKHQKLTQQQLAMMAGLSRRTIVLIESGGDCTLSTLQRIATALGLEIRARTQALPTLEDVTRENEELFANQRSLQNN
jgi:transcriptional regulator with XRE-family HTH domain